MSDVSLAVLPSGAAAAPRSRRRLPPSSQAERERRKEFGKTYGNIMRQIKIDRERRTE